MSLYRRRKSRAVRILAALALPSTLSSIVKLVAAEATRAVTDEALIQALRGEVYVLCFRQVATEWSQYNEVRAAGGWSSRDEKGMR